LIITDRVRNQGNVNAGPFNISFYLSADTVYQGGTDILICSRSVASLGAGLYDPASTNSTNTCPVPAGVTPGSYYVLAVDDSGYTVTESIENNNSRSTTTRLNVGPDLIPTTLTASTSGTNLIITDRVRNQGNVNAGPFNISFYLSADTVYQGGTDILICNRSVASLAGGLYDPATANSISTCAVPAGVTPGSYYVLAVDDSGNLVIESNESNNSRATSGTLTIP
jgi:subtilase family serine protease